MRFQSPPVQVPPLAGPQPRDQGQDMQERGGETGATAEGKARALRIAGEYLQELIPAMPANAIEAVSCGFLDGEWVVTVLYDSEGGKRKFAVIGVDEATERRICYVPEKFG